MHMIPSFVLIIILIIAWKHELVGGIGLAAFPFIYSLNYRSLVFMVSRSWRGTSGLWTPKIAAVVSFLFIIVGILFIFSYFFHRLEDGTQKLAKKGRSRILLVLTSVYALLYILFMVTEQYGTAGSEPTVVKILFALFLVGYIAVWINEGLGGAIFVVWWIGMWYLGLFVAQTDRGAAVVMGLPLFVLAVMFIFAWFKKREAARTTLSTGKSKTSRD